MLGDGAQEHVSALVAKLTKSSFIRSLVVLVGATGSAQVINFIVLPFLTRLYLPTDFGEYALFVSASGIIAGVAHLRYDQAIVLPRSKDKARLLLGSGALVAFSLSSATVVFASTLPCFILSLVQSAPSESIIGSLCWASLTSWARRLNCSLGGPFAISAFMLLRSQTFR